MTTVLLPPLRRLLLVVVLLHVFTITIYDSSKNKIINSKNKYQCHAFVINIHGSARTRSTSSLNEKWMTSSFLEIKKKASTSATSTTITTGTTASTTSLWSLAETKTQDLHTIQTQQNGRKNGQQDEQQQQQQQELAVTTTTTKKKSKFAQLMSGEQIPSLSATKTSADDYHKYYEEAKTFAKTSRTTRGNISDSSDSGDSSDGSDSSSRHSNWSISWKKQSPLKLATSNSPSDSSSSSSAGEGTSFTEIPFYSCTLRDDDIVSYEYCTDKNDNNDNNDNNASTMSTKSTSTTTITPPRLHNQRDIHYIPSLLSKDQIAAILELVKEQQQSEEEAQCFVAIEDGVPQYSNGYDDNDHDNEEEEDKEDIATSSKLINILQPILEKQVIPITRELCNAPNIVIADALIRWYGDANDNDKDTANDSANENNNDDNDDNFVEALAPHYDVSSYASMIIPLNPEDCDGGLYIQYGAGSDTRHDVSASFQNIQTHEEVQESNSSTTANASTNTSGKMNRGDAILHRYDVMHGVKFKGGPRYSLVLWMTEDMQSCVTSTAPWVTNEARNGMSVHAAFLRGMYAKDGLYGVTKSVEDAVKYWEWASERGHGLSQYCLSMLMMKVGCSNDDEKKKMVSLLSSSAEIGLDLAQHELGTFYKQGYYGVTKDEQSARRWYHAAAAQGYKRSIEILVDTNRWKD